MDELTKAKGMLDNILEGKSKEERRALLSLLLKLTEEA